MSLVMPDPAWNQTERTYPTMLLHEAFAAQVARDPSAPAVRFRDESLTYGQLEARVEVLARHLVGLGVTRDSLVAICMERSLELVVAVHAIWRAGGAYVPVDPEYPDERIAFMFEDLDEPVLLTQRRLADRFVRAAARVVPLDAPLETVAIPVATELPQVGPDDLAYVIYTSGSTGRPKGAMNTHGAIANRLYWQQEHFAITPQDVLLQKTPYTFDASLWEFFWPFMIGARLIVAEPGGHRDSAYLCQTIIEHGITVTHFVPSMLQLFLDDPRAGDCVSLRRVLSGGETLTRSLHDRFFERLPGTRLHNLYGPTEAANDVTYWDCERHSPLPFVPIGKPLANTQLHILDADMQLVPVGEVGELHIGGLQVGRGYLKRPELTAERFVPDPSRPGGRLYKTGDLVRYLPDGNVEFLGRNDFQVKIRGFRVELGEIEASLEAIDGVRGAVVVAHERAAGDQELVAYVAHGGSALSTDSLRAHLGQRLPEFMVPSTIMALERFPLNANGKVDRKALPAPVRTRPLLESAYVAPRTTLQRLIASRWCRVLDLDRVGIDDRFFELGGSSLDAARFVNGLQAELAETIYVMTLFGAPTVAEYAALLERQYPAAVERVVGAIGSQPGGAQAALVPSGRATPSTAGRTSGTRPRSTLTSQLDRRRAARGG